MEHKLDQLKEKIKEIRPFKDKLKVEEFDFFESCDYVVSRTASYWDIGHVQFGVLEQRIDKIMKIINTENS
jgi:hypothetical protein